MGRWVGGTAARPALALVSLEQGSSAPARLASTIDNIAPSLALVNRPGSRQKNMLTRHFACPIMRETPNIRLVFPIEILARDAPGALFLRRCLVDKSCDEARWAGLSLITRIRFQPRRRSRLADGRAKEAVFQYQRPSIYSGLSALKGLGLSKLKTNFLWLCPNRDPVGCRPASI